MFTLGQKRLKIIEKERSSVETPRVHLKDAINPKNGTLNFSATKLNIAIARCILSKDLSNLDLIFESLSSYFRYQTIINTTKRDLTFNKANIGQLRDFSQKTRIGELAQGITYLLSQEHLNYPMVVDFEGFVRSKNSKALFTGETPDFIIQKKTDFNYSIIESKGHYATNNSTKGKLNKALKQCENGEKIINSELGTYTMNKSYGVCVKLQNEQDKNISEIQFVDPTNFEKNDNFNLEIVRYHYASWFLLMGNMQIYEKLIGQEYLTEEDLNNNQKEEINGIQYQMFNMFDAMFPPYFYYFGHMHPRNRYRNYGIRLDVLNILMGKSNEFSETKTREIKDKYQKRYEIFYDGTIITAHNRVDGSAPK